MKIKYKVYDMKTNEMKFFTFDKNSLVDYSNWVKGVLSQQKNKYSRMMKYVRKKDYLGNELYDHDIVENIHTRKKIMIGFFSENYKSLKLNKEWVKIGTIICKYRIKKVDIYKILTEQKNKKINVIPYKSKVKMGINDVEYRG